MLKMWQRSSDNTFLIEPWAKRTQWHGKNSGTVAGWSETKDRGRELSEQGEGANIGVLGLFW